MQCIGIEYSRIIAPNYNKRVGKMSKHKTHLVEFGYPLCGVPSWSGMMTVWAADLWPRHLTCKTCKLIKQKNDRKDKKSLQKRRKELARVSGRKIEEILRRKPALA